MRKSRTKKRHGPVYARRVLATKVIKQVKGKILRGNYNLNDILDTLPLTINQEDICISVEYSPSGATKGAAKLTIIVYVDEELQSSEDMAGEYLEDSDPGELKKWNE